MKRKTAFAVLMFIAFCFTLALTAGAAGTYKQALERYPAGDVDHDGSVSSNDSRYILRESVGLELPEAFSLLISDTDGDGSVTAADARVSLRTSVGLEEEHYHQFTAVVAGSSSFRCVDCGYSFVNEKCDHRFELSCVEEQPPCKGGSAKTYTCVYCGDTKTETLPKTAAHSFAAPVTVKPATCAEAGVKTRTCTVCGEAVSETLPRLSEHSYDGGAITKKPTCQSTGTLTYTCKVCGAVKTEKTERLSSHSYDGGRMTVPVKCGSDGVMTYVCTVCGAIRTETVKSTGHRYETLEPGIVHCADCGCGSAEDAVMERCVKIGERIVFLGEDISVIVHDFGKYTRADNAFKGITVYSFAADYDNYFMAFCDGSKAVGYYVCAGDFKNGFFKKDAKTTVTMLRKSGLRVMPFIDRTHDHRVYALMLAYDTYTFTPELGKTSYFDTAAKQIFDMTNAFRVQRGMTALAWSGEISVLSEAHSVDMAANNYLEHNDLNGKTPWQRALDADIDYVYYAENIAGGSGLSYMTFDQWVNSKNHNAVLLADCTILGVGGAYSENSKYGFYWTQNFAELG